MTNLERIRFQIQGIQSQLDDIQDLIELEIREASTLEASLLRVASSELAGAEKDLKQAIQILDEGIHQ